MYRYRGDHMIPSKYFTNCRLRARFDSNKIIVQWHLKRHSVSEIVQQNYY